jgi:hypothetical protein
MKNPKKMKSGMDWGAYWQKRKAAEAANPTDKNKEKKKTSKDSIASLTKKMNTMKVGPTIHI